MYLEVTFSQMLVSSFLKLPNFGLHAPVDFMYSGVCGNHQFYSTAQGYWQKVFKPQISQGGGGQSVTFHQFLVGIKAYVIKM